MVELAELLVSTIPFCDWSFFAKNGGDATSIAVRMVRAATGRRVILRAPGSYHGIASLWREGNEANLRKEGVLATDIAFISPYTFNDIQSVRDAADAAGDDFAGIIVAAFKWDYGRPQEIATAEFLRGVRRLCDERGAALICDDVRSSFRIDPRGTWCDARYGHGVMPDISCLCKGIANGQPLSAIVGRQRWRVGAERVVATGSFWANAVPFAAALATIPLSCAAAKRAEELGLQLRAGLAGQAQRFGLDADFRQTGPPQMPFFHFESELDHPLRQRAKILKFCEVAADGGVLLHPFHTMFLGGAHTREDIRETLKVTKKAFAAVQSMLMLDDPNDDAISSSRL